MHGQLCPQPDCGGAAAGFRGRRLRGLLFRHRAKGDQPLHGQGPRRDWHRLVSAGVCRPTIRLHHYAVRPCPSDLSRLSRRAQITALGDGRSGRGRGLRRAEAGSVQAHEDGSLDPATAVCRTGSPSTARDRAECTDLTRRLSSKVGGSSRLVEQAGRRLRSGTASSRSGRVSRWVRGRRDKLGSPHQGDQHGARRQASLEPFSRRALPQRLEAVRLGGSQLEPAEE